MDCQPTIINKTTFIAHEESDIRSYEHQMLVVQSQSIENVESEDAKQWKLVAIVRHHQ
jgi:hypothetical protein